MKGTTKTAIAVVILVVAGIAFFSSGGDAEPGRYDDFAQCVTDAGAIMYGAYWCPHCEDQKNLFGKESFKKVNYVECDPRGDNADPAACQAAGIQGFPTWVFADGERSGGMIPLQTLAFRTGCELPTEA